MLKEEDCFYKITTNTNNITDYFKNNFEKLSWHEHESLWNLALVPLDVLLENNVLYTIHKKFEIEGAGFIKMDSEECYKWHKDFSRGPAINMHMNPFDCLSLCLFQTNELNKERIKYISLNYQPETFYLFNTQVEHMILTFSRTRYLFTLQFKKTKEELEYNEVLNFLKLTKDLD